MGCCESTHNQFVQECLRKHNHLRSFHGSPPLKTSKELVKYSQKWADQLAKINTLKHSDAKLRSGETIGENLYSYWSSDTSVEIDAEKAVQSWYDEIKDYNFNNGTFNSNTGHFTQVVWKSSTELGVGYAKGANGTWYVVANYRPAGNVLGEFPKNVVPRQSLRDG